MILPAMIATLRRRRTVIELEVKYRKDDVLTIFEVTHDIN